MKAGRLEMAAVYVRVSSERQVDAFSLDAQEAVLRADAARRGKLVYKVYRDEGWSGAREDRPALAELLNDAQKGLFGEVLVWMLSRLSRRLHHLLGTVEKLGSSGVVLRSVSESFDVNQAMGRFLVTSMGALAEMQRSSWMESSRIGTEKRVRQGRWSGAVPLGYHPVPDPADPHEGQTLVAVPEEAQTVRRIFELYAEGHGLKAAANRLNAEGRCTRSGKPFSIQAVRWILGNCLYAGKVKLGSIVTDGIHEPIIPVALWENVQDRLAEHSGPVRKVVEREFLLSGVLRCPECGAGMVPTHSKWRRKDGTFLTTDYYACRAYLNKGRSVCRANSVRAEAADEMVLRWLAEILVSPFWMRRVVEELGRRREAEQAPGDSERREIRAELAAYDKRQGELLAAYERGLLDRDAFLAEAQALKAERAGLQDRLTVAGDLTEEPEWTLADVQAVFRRFRKVLANSAAVKKRELIRSLVDKVTVDENRRVSGLELKLPRPGAENALAAPVAVELRLAE